MPQFTKEQVQEALVAAVAEKPEDYIHQEKIASGCFYTREDGSPSCLVANVLHRLGLGLPPYAHAPTEDEPLGGLNTKRFEALSGSLYNGAFDLETANGLQRVQDAQDAGLTWRRSAAQFTPHPMTHSPHSHPPLGGNE